MSGLRSSRYLLEAPMVIRMVLAVRKHLQITNMIILDNCSFKNSLKKAIPEDIRAQVLREPIGGSHGEQDGPGCLETHSDYQYHHTGQV